MTCRILTLQNEQEWPKAAQWLQGRSNPGDGVENAVRDILAAVRDKGDEALVDFTRRFDCPDFAPPLRVSEQQHAPGFQPADERHSGPGGGRAASGRLHAAPQGRQR